MSNSQDLQNSDQTDCTKVLLEDVGTVFAFLAFIVAALGLVGVFAISLAESQENNQIIRPNPNAPPPPVVPCLPTLIAELSKAKTLCEARALEAKDFAHRHRVRDSEICRGRRFYSDVQTELNGCIDYLRAGLIVRFTNDDPAKISERFKTTGVKMNDFMAWVDALERPRYGGIDPLAAVSDMYPKWLEAVRKANDDAIRQLRNDLDCCRMKNWQEVK